MAGGALGELPDALRDVIGIAHTNSERLVRLVDDILDIRRLEAGNMTLALESCAVRDLVEKTMYLNRDLQKEHGVEFEFDAPQEDLRIRADPDRVLQVLTNLLSNAAKFSPAGSTVTLATQRAGDMLRVLVSDQGPGIPADFQPHVFDRFSQARPSDATRKGGSGLGLSIVKALVEQHQGRVGFESPPGAGATFWFELPIEQERTEEAT